MDWGLGAEGKGKRRGEVQDRGREGSGERERRTIHDVSKIEFDDWDRIDIVCVVDVVRVGSLPR